MSLSAVSFLPISWFRAIAILAFGISINFRLNLSICTRKQISPGISIEITVSTDWFGRIVVSVVLACVWAQTQESTPPGESVLPLGAVDPQGKFSTPLSLTVPLCEEGVWLSPSRGLCGCNWDDTYQSQAWSEPSVTATYCLEAWNFCYWVLYPSRDQLGKCVTSQL